MFRPVTELAELVRSGELSATELVQSSLDRIAALNGEINAFVHIDAEGALAAAAAIGPGDERPFAGVPMAIKTETAVAGMPLTYGSDVFGDFSPGFDAFAVRRLRDAGFVFVGTTNMPEMGMLPVTEPRRFGVTRNPWNTERTPGGSSGGSAAAVAGGMVPVAHAMDGAGSIRIPASCCGLVGLKATRGRISRGPVLGDHWLVTDGVLTRTVDETARLLDLLEGYETGDATWAPPPGEPFASTAAREPGKLRVAVTTSAPNETAVDPAYATAAREAGELLASLGHEVEEATPPWTQPGLAELFLSVFGASIASGVRAGALLRGREPEPGDVEPLTWAVYESAQSLPASVYLGMVGQLQAFARSVLGFHDAYDMLVSPVVVRPPLAIGEFDTSIADVAEWGRTAHFAPFAAVANVSGQPGLSLPLYEDDDGMPLSVQLTGRPAGEGQLLAVASQLEAARPWADRRPPVSVSAG
jgi:amidase